MHAEALNGPEIDHSEDVQGVHFGINRVQSCPPGARVDAVRRSLLAPLTDRPSMSSTVCCYSAPRVLVTFQTRLEKLFLDNLISFGPSRVRVPVWTVPSVGDGSKQPRPRAQRTKFSTSVHDVKATFAGPPKVLEGHFRRRLNRC